MPFFIEYKIFPRFHRGEKRMGCKKAMRSIQRCCNKSSGTPSTKRQADKIGGFNSVFIKYGRLYVFVKRIFAFQPNLCRTQNQQNTAERTGAVQQYVETARGASRHKPLMPFVAGCK